jgi:hypothetical protein
MAHHKKHGAMHHEKKMHHGRSMGGMIHEDHSAPSNLPQGYMNTEYPMYDYINAPVPDNMAGIDHQINNAIYTAKSQLSKKKY